MTDKYIGKPVLKHCYCEHDYRNQKGASKRLQKQKKMCLWWGLNLGWRIVYRQGNLMCKIPQLFSTEFNGKQKTWIEYSTYKSYRVS